MMWGIIATITSLLLKSKAVVLVPIVYLLARKNKDLGLLAYFFYTIILMNDVFVNDFLSFDALKGILLGVFPSLMMLGEILSGGNTKKTGESYRDFLHHVGTFKVGFSLNFESIIELAPEILLLLTLVGVMGFLKLRYEYLLTTENQVAIMAGIAILYSLLNLRDTKKVKMFGE